MGIYWLIVIWRSVINMFFSFHVPFWCWLTHIRYIHIVTTPFGMCKCINFAKDNPCWIKRNFNPTIQKLWFSRHYSIFIIWSKKVKIKLEYYSVKGPFICHIITYTEKQKSFKHVLNHSHKKQKDSGWYCMFLSCHVRVSEWIHTL